jgi:hypothetical protein
VHSRLSASMRRLGQAKIAIDLSMHLDRQEGRPDRSFQVTSHLQTERHVATAETRPSSGRVLPWGNAMACDVPPRDRRGGINKRSVAFTVVAGILAAVAIALDTDQAANLLLLAAGLVLAVGLGIPLVNAAEGAPPLGSVIAAALGQGRDKPKKADLQDEFLDRLSRVTLDVTLFEPRAIQLAKEAIGQASAWVGPIDLDLFNYLLCCAVESAVSDTWQDPPIGDDDPRARLASLSRRERAILALRQSKVDDSKIAAMLDCSLAEVTGVPYPSQWSER